MSDFGLSASNARLVTILLANASDAKMARQGALTVKDHYGNPALFVKYIIRRRQTLV